MARMARMFLGWVDGRVYWGRNGGLTRDNTRVFFIRVCSRSWIWEGVAEVNHGRLGRHGSFWFLVWAVQDAL